MGSGGNYNETFVGRNYDKSIQDFVQLAARMRDDPALCRLSYKVRLTWTVNELYWHNKRKRLDPTSDFNKIRLLYDVHYRTR